MIQEKGFVAFGQAIKNFWRGYVDFKGRSTRSGYWFAALFNFLVSLVIILALAATIWYESVGLMLFFLFALIIYGLAIALPSLAITTRRITDTGLPFSIALVLALLPLIVSLVFSGVSNFVVFIINSVVNLAIFILALLPTNTFK